MLVIAPTLRVPYPILLVIGGLALGFVPGMPELELPPDLVLVAVLPPLLYAGTFFTSLRELKLNLRPIGLLSRRARAGDDARRWPSSPTPRSTISPGARRSCSGAIVSPTDPIAATAIARRFGVPRRLVTIVEGESLINDGTALVAYRFAVVAVVSRAASPSGKPGSVRLRRGRWDRHRPGRRLADPATATSARQSSARDHDRPAHRLPRLHAGRSCRRVGRPRGGHRRHLHGRHTSELTTAQTRVQGDAVWEIVVFMLNALLFVLIGLQLPVILDELSGDPRARCSSTA